MGAEKHLTTGLRLTEAPFTAAIAHRFLGHLFWAQNDPAGARSHCEAVQNQNGIGYARMQLGVQHTGDRSAARTHYAQALHTVGHAEITSRPCAA